MAKALYRKYRPKKLSEVVGQSSVTDTLANSLKQGKVSHAYLFVGPRGTGKTSVARIFAHEINHFPYELEDDYVDIIEIDGASNRGIEDIRELREKVTIAPSEGKFKVYIIDEVHMLTRDAFNALLKTLEEPPAHVVFIMATTEVQKVPATILSRTQTYNFSLADPQTMLDFLRQIAKAEKIKITDGALELLVKRGGGSFRDSLSLLDQISTLSDQEITEELIISALGLPTAAAVEQLLTAYQAGDLTQISNTLRDLLATGIKPELITEGLIAQIVASPQPEHLGLLSRLPSVTAPFAEAKLLVALTTELRAAPIPRASALAANITEGPTSTPAPAQNITKNQANTPVSAQSTPASTPQTTATTASQATPTNPQAVQSVDTTTQAQTTPTTSAPITSPFTWRDFLAKFQTLSDTIYDKLKLCHHELSGNTLHIYPPSAAAKRILSSKNNLQLLANEASDLNVVIDEIQKPSTTPENSPKSNSRAAQISAIMGGEVKEYGGEDPF